MTGYQTSGYSSFGSYYYDYYYNLALGIPVSGNSSSQSNQSNENNLPECTRSGSTRDSGISATTISFWEAYGPGGLSDNAWHEIAEEAQEQFGNDVHYDDALGFVLTAHTFVRMPIVGTIPGISLTVPIFGDPNRSLYENIMLQMDREPREEALEEYACQ